MINRFPLLFIILLIPSFLFSQDLEGSWEGKLKISPEVALRVVINITDLKSDTPLVTIDSPDQGAYGIPVNVGFISNDSISLSVPKLLLTYRGKLDANSIKGEFSQGGMVLPLILSPKSNYLNRPQTPTTPFPYNSEEVSFPSSIDQNLLYGTFTSPVNTTSKTPVVVMLSGSGTQNRDEEIFEHKPFAVIADFLAKKGIASLRYDDRGFDSSTGLTPNQTTYENAMDAKGAVDYLKSKGFKEIGLIGHSEGGLIADMLASSDNDIDFVVEIGGPTLSGDSILLFQNEFLLKDGKMPEEYISIYLDAMKGMFNSQKNNSSISFNESDYDIFSDKLTYNPIVAPLAENLRQNFRELKPWLKFFINYDPMKDIKKIKCPILFLYGEKDTQVPPALNVPILEKEYPKAKIKVYPELNHLMQHAKTGKVTEYAEIEETISPEVLEDITDFIKSIAEN